MPRLPDEMSLGNLPAPEPATSVAQVQPAGLRAASIPGQFLQKAGGEVEQAGQIIEHTNRQQDQIAAEDGLNRLRQKTMDLEYDPQIGFRNVQGSGAIGKQFFDDYQNRFQDAQKDIADSLQNDQQKQMFQQRAAIASGQYRGNLLAHMAQQTEHFASNTEKSSVQVELQTMAANPTNDVSFKSGLERINGIIEGRANRLNMPPAQVQEQKNEVLDAAWSTRIKSILYQNPYAAEKMFEANQQNLGPKSQIILSHEVQKEVQMVQQRDYAQQRVFGNKTLVSPSQIAPATDGIRPLEGIVKDMESGGKRYDKDGNLLTSSAGAQGEMQVMGYTARDPGFGVVPAKDNSPEELARVGKDYLGAMTARYQDPALVLAAYNAGPGKVDQWISQFGDPRSGQISAKDWADKIPFAETKNYVTNGLQKVNAQTQGTGLISAPTAKELKTQLPAIVEKARQDAREMYPNDPVFEDGMASRVTANANLVIANWDAQQSAARDMLTRGLVGTKPDGSDKPVTIDQLLSNPQMKDAWNQATPEVQLAIQGHFKNGEPPRTPQSTNLFYQKIGQYSNDRDGFANEDLSKLITQLPYDQWHSLAEMQVRARNKIESDADKQTNMLHAMSVAETYALKPLKIMIPNKDTPQNQRQAYDQFTGAYSQQIDQFQAENKRRPNDQELIQIAKNLTTTVNQKGGSWFGFAGKDVPAFTVSPDQEQNIDAKLSDKDSQRLTSGFVSRYGVAPNPGELQQLKLAEMLHAHDHDYLMQLDQQIRKNVSSRQRVNSVPK